MKTCFSLGGRGRKEVWISSYTGEENKRHLRQKQGRFLGKLARAQSAAATRWKTTAETRARSRWEGLTRL